jgi:hypothetical protein
VRKAGKIEVGDTFKETEKETLREREGRRKHKK